MNPRLLKTRLLVKLRQLEDGGQKMTQKELAKRAGCGKATIQNLLREVDKQYRAETLISIAAALGESADFFFRESVESVDAHTVPDREAVAHAVFRAVHANCGTRNFTLVCAHPDGTMEVIAFKNGDMIYHGPERRTHTGRRKGKKP